MRDGHVRNFRLMINLNGRSDFGKAKRQPVKRFFRRRQRLIHRKLIQMIKRLVDRSKEHTSELQSIMRISSAVFCLKKKKQKQAKETNHTHLKHYTTNILTHNKHTTISPNTIIK